MTIKTTNIPSLPDPLPLDTAHPWPTFALSNEDRQKLLANGHPEESIEFIENVSDPKTSSIVVDFKTSRMLSVSLAAEKQKKEATIQRTLAPTSQPQSTPVPSTPQPQSTPVPSTPQPQPALAAQKNTTPQSSSPGSAPIERQASGASKSSLLVAFLTLVVVLENILAFHITSFIPFFVTLATGLAIFALLIGLIALLTAGKSAAPWRSIVVGMIGIMLSILALILTQHN